MTFPVPLSIPEEVLAIARTLEGAGFEAWCVGGALRDALLDDLHSDYDIATSATPDQVQKLFRRTAAVGVKYGTVGVLDRNRVLHEVTTFRRDVSTDGRHAVVAFGVSLEDDLARRDFTINAMAYHPLRREWRDPFGGAADLERGIVRAVGEPAARFQEDYLRVLRAIRFAARFGFAIDPDTWEAARAAAPGLGRLSAERVRDEWFKGLTSARSIELLVRLWRDVGAAQRWLPELTAEAAGAMAIDPPPRRDPVLLTTLLCRDPGGVLRRLKASNAEVHRAAAIAVAPVQPERAGPAAVRRWLSRAGDAADDLLELWALRHGVEAPWAPAVRESRERHDPIGRRDLAVSGADLQRLGMTGRRVGEVLAELLDRVLEDPGSNTRETLLRIARELG
jgi:tRNA nucleotidyltransferase (CCA-adding enzyme)